MQESDRHTSTPVKVQLELNCCEGLQLLSVIKKQIFLKRHNVQVLSGVHFLAEGLARAHFLPLFPHSPNSESSSDRQQKQSALSFFSMAGPGLRLIGTYGPRKQTVNTLSAGEFEQIAVLPFKPPIASHLTDSIDSFLLVIKGKTTGRQSR